MDGEIKERNKVMDYLRVLAMGMIIFDHLGLVRCSSWIVGNAVDFIFCRPLHIIQFFGGLGVCLFFLLSGFFFIDSINKIQNKIKFIAKKLITLYIPCLASFIFFWVFQKVMTMIFKEVTWWQQFSMKQWVESGTLVAYLFGGTDVINGTTWFLVPLIIFLIMGTIIYRIKCNAVMKIMINEIVILILYDLGKVYFDVPLLKSLGVWSWYITFIIAGCIFFYTKNIEIKKKTAVILMLINYGVALTGVYLYAPEYYENAPYLVSFIYAILLFLVALNVQSEVTKENKILHYFAKISYSVYLVHMTFGSYVLTVLEKKIPYTAAFSVALIVVFIVSLVIYYGVEKPIRQIWNKVEK